MESRFNAAPNTEFFNKIRQNSTSPATSTTKRIAIWRMRSAYFAILPPHINIAEQRLQLAIEIESVAAQTRSH